MENTQLTKASLKVTGVLHSEVVLLPTNKLGQFLNNLNARKKLFNNATTPR
jgi:hypothetical protein